MDRSDDRPQSSGGLEHSRKPQLPNFDNFVRAVGHPDLAYRGSFRLDTAFTSPLSGQSSLPTPPSTSGSRGSWLVPESRQHDSQSAILEDHEFAPVDTYRRASFALSAESRYQPRPTRAYSSTLSSTHPGLMNWQHGQVIREDEVPGKGRCYVYDDGSICPKEVDGDTVNPKWGTTKAGKPRKRLSQACSSCREKKIRCDGPCGPGLSKCSQCVRSNRTCIFQGGTNSRQGHRSPKLHTSTNSPGGMHANSPKDYFYSRKSSLAPTEASTPTDVARRISSKLAEATNEVSSPIMSENHVSDAPTPSKRQRVNTEAPLYGWKGTSFDAASSTTGNEIYTEGFASHTDPVLANDRLTRHYLNAFMEHVNTSTFEIFPPERFMRWALNHSPKSLCDRLVLYAMMAFGTIHSSDRDRASHRMIYKEIVYRELDQVELRYCLQTVHILHFLAFAEFADGNPKAFSLFARCVGAMAVMQLNVEQSGQQEETPYGFPSTVYAECRRRTYYAISCTDTFSCISKGDPKMLQNSDIFLRLPCARQLYEEDRIPELPVFDQDYVIPKSVTQQDYVVMGDMVWLLQIATICSEIQLNVWRHQQCIKVGRRYVLDRSTRQKLKEKLDWWSDAYEDAMRAKESRSDKESDKHLNNRYGSDKSRRFAGLDVLYHYAHMELNRRVHHGDLSEREIMSHARSANIHAVELLKLAQQIQQRDGYNVRDHTIVTRGVLTGYAIHTAIDIVTAAGKTVDILEPASKIMSLMYSSSQLLEQLTNWWISARQQHAFVKERIQLVWQKAQVALSEQRPYFYCSHPMVQVVDMDFDLIYGTNRKQYLRAAYSITTTLSDLEVYNINTAMKKV